MTARTPVPAVILVFFIVGMALPSVRLRLRTGKSAFVLHREANSVQRVIGAFMSLFMLALLLWGGLHAVCGPEWLGVWRVPLAVTVVGWLVVVTGMLVVLLAQAQMGGSWRIGIDTERTALVTSGLFALVRNPIFSGMLLMLLGLVLLSPSPWSIMAVPNYLVLVMVQTRLEEEHLAALRGHQYRAYMSRVGRFFPGVGRR